MNGSVFTGQYSELPLSVRAAISGFLGEAANAAIIGVIMAASIGLGFFNEFRAGRAAVVPADLRLLSAHGLSCDESIVTGEFLPVAKSVETVAAAIGLGDLRCCLLMGTVVQSGSATAVVVATGRDTEFGTIAHGLAAQDPRTEFQRGLAKFSTLLLQVALALTVAIFLTHAWMQRPLLTTLTVVALGAWLPHSPFAG